MPNTMNVICLSILAAVLIGGVTSAGPPPNANGKPNYDLYPDTQGYPPAPLYPQNPKDCPNQNPASLTYSGNCKRLKNLYDSAPEYVDMNAKSCTPAKCQCDAQCCAGQTCYYGCQAGAYQSLISLNNDCYGNTYNGAVLEENGDDYCEALARNTFGPEPSSGDERNLCDGGSCGVCAEHWCARLDVIDSQVPPANGMCRRAEQTGQCLNECGLEDCTGDLLCVKNIRSPPGMPGSYGYDTYGDGYDPAYPDAAGDGYVPPGSDPVYPVAANGNGADYPPKYPPPPPKCPLPLGYPLQCNGVKSTFNPLVGPTDFAQLCNPGKYSSFRLTKGKCDQAPKCREQSYYTSYDKQPTHVLQFEVLRAPNSLCDTACGSQEFRYGNWGACAGKDYMGKDLCFVAADHNGNDAGTCELDCMGASVHPCNYPGAGPKKPAAHPKKPAYAPPAYHDPATQDSTGDATTHLVMTAASVALAHSML